MDAVTLVSLVLALVPGSTAPRSEATRVSVRLAPATGWISTQCEREDVEAALRQRVDRSQTLRWVDDDAEAQVTLHLLECGEVRDSRVIVEADHQPLKIPPEGSGAGYGGESVYSVRTQTRTFVFLRLRASWQDGADELSAREEGRSLGETARVVVKELEGLVRHWGLAARPSVPRPTGHPPARQPRPALAAGAVSITGH